MATYRAQPSRPDRAKAIAAVALAHAALAALILSGLDVRSVHHAIDRLKAFDITLPPPPPPTPPPQPSPARAKNQEGAAAKKALPTPIVAPQVRIPIRPPVVAAPVPATGSASTAGAAAAGSGTGAGGSGSGIGGGGGDGAGGGETPAKLIEKIRNNDYRAIAGGRMPFGRAAMTVRVNPDGRASHCRIAGSSGDAGVDSALCALAVRRLRFRPALDRAGRTIAQDITYTATWQPY